MRMYIDAYNKRFSSGTVLFNTVRHVRRKINQSCQLSLANQIVMFNLRPNIDSLRFNKSICTIYADTTC